MCSLWVVGMLALCLCILSENVARRYMCAVCVFHTVNMGKQIQGSMKAWEGYAAVSEGVDSSCPVSLPTVSHLQ